MLVFLLKGIRLPPGILGQLVAVSTFFILVGAFLRWEFCNRDGGKIILYIWLIVYLPLVSAGMLLGKFSFVLLGMPLILFLYIYGIRLKEED